MPRISVFREFCGQLHAHLTCTSPQVNLLEGFTIVTSHRLPVVMSNRKRSRFDQTDSAGADSRRSRFDRRSRSPAERDAASNRRSRSPQGDATNGSASKSSAASSAAAAAAAAAAKINAQLQAKKAAGQLTPTPVRPVRMDPGHISAINRLTFTGSKNCFVC